MKYIIFSAIFLFFIVGCGSQTEHEAKIESVEKESNEPEWDYRKVNKTYIDSLMVDICSAQGIEIEDLYPLLDSIASDTYEKAVLVDSLKNKGFTVTDWSRGNWMEGPRIVSYTMSDCTCECRLDKLYYATENMGIYKVTERIKCIKD